IIMDPEIDFGALFEQFDTFLIGRRTFQGMARAGQGKSSEVKTFVFSRTLRQSDYSNVTVVGKNAKETVARLRKQKGKDIWLFGGGSLFRSLSDAGVVDTVEVAIVPVLLGGGIPLLPPPARSAKLKLTGQKVYKKTGIVSLEYRVKTR